MKHALAIVLMFLVIFSGACKKKADNNDLKSLLLSAAAINISMSGKLGSSYATSPSKNVFGKIVAAISPRFAETPYSVDTVMAVPIQQPFIVTNDIIDGAVTAPVNADGTFNIAVDKTRDWVLLLIDSTAPKKDQVVSFAALGDPSDNLIMMPAQRATGDIKMGDLEKSGDEAVSDNSLAENVTNFSLNIAQLREIARMDNVLKTIKNIYVNYDKQTGKFYSQLLAYRWNVAPENAKNKFCGASAFSLGGYYPSINSRNENDINYDAVKNKSITLTLVPPVPVTSDNGNTYGSFSSSGVLTEVIRTNDRILSTNEPPFALILNNNGWIQVGVGLVENIVDGWWSLQKDTMEIAAFDFGMASPIDASGHPIVYVPSLNVTVGADDTIQQVDIKWYQYDATAGDYIEVIDFTEFNRCKEMFAVALMDADTLEEISRDISKETIIPTNTWKYFGSASGGKVVKAIQVVYRIYGVDCTFWLQAPPY